MFSGIRATLLKLSLLSILIHSSQSQFKICFKQHTANDIKLSREQLDVNVCKFYISNVTLKNKSKIIYFEKNTSHLIDIKSENNFCIYHNISEPFDEVTFGIGVDSVNNWNGVSGGDLDPVNGMYWTWQTGYINFKLEAVQSNEKKQRNIEFHVGGFLGPNSAYKVKSLKIKSEKTDQVVINLDLDKFIKNSFGHVPDVVMAPGPNALILSELFSDCFFVND
ncbi:MAG: MbnP family protein [Bacteroidota bacterium]|jgi:hypothetical protein